MKSNDFIYIIAIVNIVEGSLGIIYGKIFVRGWIEISFLGATLLILSGLIFLYFLQNNSKY